MPRDARATRPRLDERIEVVIASNTAETLDGLQSYLSAAGLSVRGTRRLGDALGSETLAALIVFADDFESDEVADAIAKLGRDGSDIVTMLVSGEPRRLEELAARHGGGAVVLPRPAWGSTILDTLRARLGAGSKNRPTRGGF